ncbi:uncharacterized protein EI90DRAFT_3289830 [Cantharellus anzutake]|uniref:uncharacterized protein n=1 Tax=Cantharellus anzutake TaxID=1750568 RepID=UPI0019060E1C|nr:uncharacterized protein EI90DRAFT_3289830 [Cantharellus anzutake]KAF8330386.1 hypothetical protein EI90DRAFT_3289830 [Cantharellus anzutake]
MRFWNLFTPIAFLPIATADFTVGTVSLTTSQGAAVNSSTINGYFQFGEQMRFNLCDSVVQIIHTTWILLPEELGANGTCSKIQGPVQPCTIYGAVYKWNARLSCPSLISHG